MRDVKEGVNLMKTTAFSVRITICLLLSQVPVTELENRIYAKRLQWRSYPRKVSNIIIVDRNRSEGLLRKGLSKQKPSLILDVEFEHHANHLLNQSDGIIRQAVLTVKNHPSLSYFAASQLNIAHKLVGSLEEPHYINFAGPAGTFTHCRDSDVSLLECKDLDNKIILLNDEQKAYSSFHTPLGEMSLTELLANDLDTIVGMHPIHQPPWIVNILITLAMILIAAIYIIYYPVLISAIAITFTGTLIVIVLFQILFQLFDLYFPSANIVCSLLFTYLIFTGYRLAFQENLQWRSLKQAQYLRELDRMKTNFLTLVSHDLKTPLAKIQAVVEKIRRELNLPPHERSDWREMIDSIENSNNEMQHFITSILNFSKIESQKVILNKKSNDINLLIQQALKRLSPLAQQKGIKIEQILDPLFSIECDEDLMRQVLTNLIDNAIKYSPHQGKIIVRSKEEEGFVRVEVEDFGPGIPRDELPLMFRKFSRFLRPIKEQVKGTGLGLYLSKYFIELHGGTIRVNSEVGRGTIFTFTLPFQSSEAPNSEKITQS